MAAVAAEGITEVRTAAALRRVVRKHAQKAARVACHGCLVSAGLKDTVLVSGPE